MRRDFSDSGVEGPGRLFFGPLTTLSAIVITILGIYVNLTHETLLKWRNHDNPWKLRLGRAVNNVALVSAVVSASGIFVAGGVPVPYAPPKNCVLAVTFRSANGVGGHAPSGRAARFFRRRFVYVLHHNAVNNGSVVRLAHGSSHHIVSDHYRRLCRM
jgi:hypothetical protein